MRENNLKSFLSKLTLSSFMASKKAKESISTEEEDADLPPENRGKVFFLVNSRCKACGCRERVYVKKTGITLCSVCGKRMPKIRGISL